MIRVCTRLCFCTFLFVHFVCVCVDASQKKTLFPPFFCELWAVAAFAHEFPPFIYVFVLCAKATLRLLAFCFALCVNVCLVQPPFCFAVLSFSSFPLSLIVLVSVCLSLFFVCVYTRAEMCAHYSFSFSFFLSLLFFCVLSLILHRMLFSLVFGSNRDFALILSGFPF